MRRLLPIILLLTLACDRDEASGSLSTTGDDADLCMGSVGALEGEWAFLMGKIGDGIVCGRSPTWSEREIQIAYREKTTQATEAQAKSLVTHFPVALDIETDWNGDDSNRSATYRESGTQNALDLQAIKHETDRAPEAGTDSTLLIRWREAGLPPPPQAAPVLSLIDAVHRNDTGPLADVFTVDLGGAVLRDGLDATLEVYRGAFSDVLGATPAASEFQFRYAGDDAAGTITVTYEDKSLPPLKVAKEGTAWRVAER